MRLCTHPTHDHTCKCRWEGGTHLTGFVHAPSRLPAQPKNFTGLMHQCDLVPTLLGAAGLTPNASDRVIVSSEGGEATPSQPLPPMDGMNMWPFLANTSATDGPRTSVILNVS